jgi:hypothetical protein
MVEDSIILRSMVIIDVQKTRGLFAASKAKASADKYEKP